jgi:hypothetical protein
MLKRSEDMAPVRSRRVHGDLKKKILLSAYEVEHQASGRQVQRLEVRQGAVVAVTTPPEIISYYHLNHSIWSLRDNKEVSR